MITVSLAGCAHIHTPGFIKRMNDRKDVSVKWVYDHREERAATCALDLSAQTVSDVRTIWDDPEVDAVVICSETDRHESLVTAAAAAGKDLFVEKPLGLGAADAGRMADAIERAGVRFQTGYFQRGTPIHQFLYGRIREGAFGRITRIRHSNCHAGALKGWFDTDWRWMADPAIAGCGGFGDLGTHSLDILLWLMGDVTAVTASIGTVTGRYGGCDEFGEGLLEFQSGAVGSLAAGWVDIAHPVSLILSGTEGHAHVSQGELFITGGSFPGADGSKPWNDLPAAQPHAFELFLDAVGGKDVPLVEPREAARRSTVMEAMYRAAARRTWIDT